MTFQSLLENQQGRKLPHNLQKDIFGLKIIDLGLLKNAIYIFRKISQPP